MHPEAKNQVVDDFIADFRRNLALVIVGKAPAYLRLKPVIYKVSGELQRKNVLHFILRAVGVSIERFIFRVAGNTGPVMFHDILGKLKTRQQLSKEIAV